MPSYRLTSDEHFEFLTKRNQPEKLVTRSNKADLQKIGKKVTKKKMSENRVNQPESTRPIAIKKKEKCSSLRPADSNNRVPCGYCKKRFNTPEDPKCNEDWLP